MTRRKQNANNNHASLWVKVLVVVLLLAGGIFLFAGNWGCTTASIRPRPSDYQKPYRTTMTVTGYCNCRQCCNWKYNWYGRPVYASGPNAGKPKKIGMTASGTRAGMGTLAADTRYYPFGTIIEIPGYGYGRVEDRGGAIKGNHVDAWFYSHQRAKQWGKKKLSVKVWLPKKSTRKR